MALRWFQGVDAGLKTVDFVAVVISVELVNASCKVLNGMCWVRLSRLILTALFGESMDMLSPLMESGSDGLCVDPSGMCARDGLWRNTTWSKLTSFPSSSPLDIISSASDPNDKLEGKLDSASWAPPSAASFITQLRAMLMAWSCSSKMHARRWAISAFKERLDGQLWSGGAAKSHSDIGEMRVAALYKH